MLLINLASVFGQTNPADSVESPIYNWKLVHHYIDAEEAVLDTSLRLFHIYNPLYELYEYPAYLGTLGSPGISNHYFNRVHTQFFFLKYYLPYLNMPENQLYYNTKKPFTHFEYSTGGGRQKQEQKLGIIHTQNVNRNFNVGLKLDVFSSEGQYPFQKASVNAFNFFTSYTGERYSIHGHAGINDLTLEENGGIQDDGSLDENKTEDVPTNLDTFNEAGTRHRNRNVHIVQTLTIGRFQSQPDQDTLKTIKEDQKQQNEWGRLSHVMQYRKNHKTYEDLDPESGYYRNIFIDSLNTYDSVYYRSWVNALTLDFSSNPQRKFRFAARVGIENELNRYSHNMPPQVSGVRSGPIQEFTHPNGVGVVVDRTDTSYTMRTNRNVSNTAVRGRLVNDVGETFGWNATGRLYFQGYKQGNLRLEGHIYTNFKTPKGVSSLNLYGVFRNERPDFWFSNFSSNHFMWSTDLKFENEIKVQATYDHPGRFMKLNANLALLSNLVYFDSLAVPAQEESSFIVFSADIKKDFKLWKIRFLNQANFQFSANEEVLSLPAVSFRNSTFFDHVFYFPWTDGHLSTQLGFDLYYFTPFYAYAYMPATGQFYNQKEKKIGNYPFVDVFLNLKVKRTRIFLKFEHVTSGLLGNQYFTILHHPMNRRVFLFGLAWTFYD
mgnify:CR=1 FL=1